MKKLHMMKKKMTISNFFQSLLIFTCIAISVPLNAQKIPTNDIQMEKEKYVDGQLIVQLKPDQDMSSVLAEYVKGYEFKSEKLLSKTMRTYLVSFNTQKIEHKDASSLLMRNPKISLVQNNHYVTLRSTTPNDTEFGQQWHHLNTGQGGGTVDADIDSDEAWDTTTGGTTATGDDIVVCLLEGANMNHPDLIDNRWENPNEIPGNGIDDDGNGYIDDIYGWNVSTNNDNNTGGGHGTSCAGMIGAKGDNNLGVSGVNWNVKIMVVDGFNVGTSAAAEASVISAYDYALQNRITYDQTGGTGGAFVVATSASWGIDSGDPNDVPLWCQFYDTLGTYGILNCGATTNQNLNVDVSGDIPTACSSPYMIGLGRSDANDNFAGGYGATTIDLAAPGINVRTTGGASGYTTTTGTSFSCPLTAGAIALLYSAPCPQLMAIVQADPQQGADIVRSALLNGVDVKPSLTGNFITNGRLNVNNSLNEILNNYCSGTVCLPPGSLVVDNTNDNDASVSWTPIGSSTDFVLYYQEVGTGSWTSQNVSGTSTTISGLSACTTYDFYLETDCGGGTFSSASDILSFTTSGCGNCVDLNYCSSLSNNNNSIDLSIIEGQSGASNFNHEPPTAWGADLSSTYAAGNLVIVDDGTAADSLGCNTLTNAAAVNGNIAVVYRGDCQFGTKALNAQNAGAIGVIVINNVAGTMDMGAGNDGAAVNIPVTMINPNDGASIQEAIDNGTNVFGILGTKSEWIENVSINSYSNNSGDDNGYGDYLLQSGVNLTQGALVSLTLDPGFQNQAYPIYFRTWVDFDQNGSFEPNELIIDQTNSSLTGITETVNIPGTASLGSTRMRIMMSYMGPGQTLLPDVCDNFSWGEVEDYCVDIQEGDVSSLDKESDWSIDVYPNPTNNLLHFNVNHPNATSLTIYYISGQKIKELNINEGVNVIDVSTMSSGIYIYNIKNSTGETIKNERFQISK